MKKFIYILFLLPLLTIGQIVPFGFMESDSSNPNPELLGDFGHVYNSGTTSTLPTGGFGNQEIRQVYSATAVNVADATHGLGDYVMEVTVDADVASPRVQNWITGTLGEIYEFKFTIENTVGTFARIAFWNGASNEVIQYSADTTYTEYSFEVTCTTATTMYASYGFQSASDIGDKIRIKASLKLKDD